ncbi:hypothetical protein BBH99_11420 [Chryseobacterium contaminans]|uniref:Uncharacterized protein n=1 Tax=Chryseobacterium contaminans TaxID=1423959 RepID=A0A1M7DCF5_9FLAO|nr:hypothetical protein [Chryseobacterium contaminans]OCA77671.1 hypothetical protein BBH99_11420 [Chryseobacterium contaminans]SHL77047.1 hypothetical protein SAMN05444407_10660 [Chryseobacterium contaminans]
MIELIQQNKLAEFKQALKELEELQIHEYLYEILDNNPVEIDEESFFPDGYQIEFLEGLQLYKALEKSEINSDHLKQYSNLLVHLAFFMSSHVQNLAHEAMSQNTYLTDLGHIYRFRIYPEIREGIQELIDLLKDRSGEEKSIANLAAAKAKVSNSIDNILEKYQIGEDMLQFAEAFEKVGETETAIKIHQGIMNDFECESVKLSSGIIPEMTHVDDRPEAEIEIFNKAKINFERLTGKKVQEPNRIHIKESRQSEKMAPSTIETSHSHDELINSSQPDHSSSKPSGLLDKVKRFFGKN